MRAIKVVAYSGCKVSGSFVKLEKEELHFKKAMEVKVLEELMEYPLE